MLQRIAIAPLKSYVLRFIKTAAIIAAMFLVFRLFNHFFGIKHLLRSISAEAWLGVGLTVLTTIGGVIIEKQKDRSQYLQSRQESNRQLIESSHAEIVSFVRGLEDAIDDFNVRLLSLKSLQEADKELQNTDQKLMERLHEIEVLLAAIQEKQQAIDYLLLSFGTIKQLCEDVAVMKEKLP